MPDKYTVVVRGGVFELSRSQIEFDAPNYFKSAFLGDFKESSTHKVEVDRSPELFRVIVEYLSGYTVLPLSSRAIPLTMTAENALKNLLLDAEYYQLQGLVRLIRPMATVLATVPGALYSPGEAYRVLDIAPRATLAFNDLMGGEERHPGVIFDREQGVGCVFDGQWKRALLSMEGKIIFEKDALRPMFTTTQQAKLSANGILDSYGAWAAPIIYEGTSYVMPAGITYTLQSDIRVHGCKIAPETLNRFCRQIVRPYGEQREPSTPDEKKVFKDLQATFKEGKAVEDPKIALWCRKLLFTLTTNSIDIVHADCIIRDGFPSQLVNETSSL